MRYSAGFTLIETLLVILVISGIALLSINHYRMYEKQIQIAAINNDVAVIFQALDRYYHRQGCFTNGTFAGNYNPSMTNLLLTTSYNNRMPLVHNYRTSVFDTGLVTHKHKKHINQLTVSAEFNEHLTAGEMRYYQHILGGKLQGHEITWAALPNSRAINFSKQFWILNSDRAYFKQRQQSDSSIASNSQCVH